MTKARSTSRVRAFVLSGYGLPSGVGTDRNLARANVTRKSYHREVGP